MKEFIGSQITDPRMKTIRIVVKFEVFDQRSGCGLECEMPDIGHLTFEGSPETLYGLVVVGRTGTRHALSETVLLNQLLGSLGSILTASVTVVHSTLGANRVSSYGHFKGILDDFLSLMTLDRPADQPSGRHINDTAGVDLTPFALELGDIRAPQIVGNVHRKLVFNQILFVILLFSWLRLLFTACSTALGYQSIFFQDSGDLVLADRKSVSRQFLFDTDPTVIALVLFKTVNYSFFKFNFVTFFCLGNAIICAS